MRTRLAETATSKEAQVAEVLADKTISPTSTQSIRAAVDLVTQDSVLLDRVIGAKSQLTAPELAVVAGGALAAFAAPALVGPKAQEILLPAIGATTAAIGFSSEYIGRTAMSSSKETAAITIQAAAECELVIASAERVKSVVPFAAALSVSGIAFAFVAPTLIETLNAKYGLSIAKHLCLIVPIVSSIATVVAAIATKDMGVLCRRAIAMNKQPVAAFARKRNIPLEDNSAEKFKSVLFATLAGPIIAAITPAPHGLGVGFSGLLWTAIAATQGAWYLVTSEYQLARAQDSLALKARAAAVSDAYANQAQRSAALLPFNSALGGLSFACAAVVAEILPVIEQYPVAVSCFASGIFPAIGAFFASCATVAKARCEIDAAAARKASDNFGEYGPNGASEPFGRGVLEPVGGVKELVTLVVKSTFKAGGDGWDRVFGNFFKGGRKDAKLAAA